MKLETKDLKPSKARIHGFNGAATDAVGYVDYQLNWDKVNVGECESYHS